MAQALRWHIVSTTGLMIGTTSVYALVELYIIGMDPVVSLRARLLIMALAFGGLGLAFVRLRELSKRIFGISDEHSSNRRIVVHDLLYVVAFNACTAPLLYVLAGASPREVALGTALALLIAIVNGPLNGYLVDLSGELSCLRPSARIPVAVQRLAPGRKWALFVGLVVVTLLALGLLYGSHIRR